MLFGLLHKITKMHNFVVSVQNIKINFHMLNRLKETFVKIKLSDELNKIPQNMDVLSLFSCNKEGQSLINFCTSQAFVLRQT